MMRSMLLGPLHSDILRIVALALLLLIGYFPARFAVADELIPTKDLKLSNGLQVFLHEDHRHPFVAINVNYNAGIAQEPIGQSGVARIFDYLMYGSTEHLAPHSVWHYLTQSGAIRMNDGISWNHSNYYEVVPSANLEIALWVESERMSFLLPEAWNQGFETVPETMARDLTQKYQNAPNYAARQKLLQALFPPSHPYHYGGILPEHLSSISKRAAQDYYLTNYSPANATLVLAGDLDPLKAEQLILKYFNDLPRVRGKNVRTNPPPVVSVNQQIVIHHNEEAGKTPALQFAWLTPSYRTKEDTVADFVAQLLARGGTGRLTRLLANDQRIISAYAYQSSSENQSIFTIGISGTNKTPLRDLQEIVDRTLIEIAQNGVLEREIQSIQRWERRSILERMHSIWGKAVLIQEMNRIGKEKQGINELLARYDFITSADVQKFVENYLGPQKRVVQHIIPSRN